jgi:hypothetical protein
MGPDGNGSGDTLLNLDAETAVAPFNLMGASNVVAKQQNR